MKPPRKKLKALKTYAKVRELILDHALMGHEFEVWFEDGDFIFRIDAMAPDGSDRTVLWRRTCIGYGSFRVFDAAETVSRLREYYIVKRYVRAYEIDLVDRGSDIGQIDRWPPGPLFD